MTVPSAAPVAAMERAASDQSSKASGFKSAVTHGIRRRACRMIVAQSGGRPDRCAGRIRILEEVR
jgi:hypothetical protein